MLLGYGRFSQRLCGRIHPIFRRSSPDRFISIC
jgi:hypothetical protein